MTVETAIRPSASSQSTVCDLCGQEATKPVLLLAKRSLSMCCGCGLVRLTPTPTPQELSAVYDTSAYYTHEEPRISGSRADAIRNAVLNAYWGYPDQRSVLKRLTGALILWPLRERAMPVKYPGSMPVLDIGCGNGQRLLELEARGCTNLYGVEPTAGAADQARKCTRADIRTSLLEEAGLPENHFQLVIMNQVLEHVPSPSATLRTVHEMLRLGGELYLTVPNYGGLEAKLFGKYWSGLQIPAHLHHFTPGPLRKLIEAAGFQVVTWRTDTTLAITAASLRDWNLTNSTRLSRLIAGLPPISLAPATLLADLLGRGQMLRVVARRV